MTGKAKSKRPKKQSETKSITIGGNVDRSEIHIGDTFINPNTHVLVPPVLNDEYPLPSSLDFYLGVPLAKIGNFIGGRNGTARVPFAFFVALLIYAGGIFAFRTFQETPLPASISDMLFHIAPGGYFYYPDWNAIAFDFILNPLAVVVSIFYHRTIFSQLSSLMRGGVLKIEETWNKRLSSRYWLWVALMIPLILGVAAIALSWISRYQYYTSDLLVFRSYVLVLIGLSTFLRTSMLISLLHAAILSSVSVSSIPLDILNPVTRRKYQNLGESCLMINFGGLLILLYAATTIYTSIVKGVSLEDDYLFWEAVFHLAAVFLILIYYNYQQTLVARYVQRLKDDYFENNLKTETDLTQYRELSALLKEIPNHPMWDSFRMHWPTLMSILLMALLPSVLFTIGRSSN